MHCGAPGCDRCWREFPRLSSARRLAERGCEYCADDSNMYFGRVSQIASDEDNRTLLLQCPRCGWLYETSPRGARDARQITEGEARGRYGL